MLTYFKNVLIALDVFLSTLFGFSDADITISSVCGLAIKHRTGLLEQLIGTALNWAFPGHTMNAIDHDVARAEAAIKRLQS
jgi:hypothetical protein